MGEETAIPAAGEFVQSSRQSSTTLIAKIERVPLREVWRHEAHNLTTWLEENIDVLNDVLDLQLTNVERERATGSFSADLVAEDTSGGIVVIENQLERSNHDHLGELLTANAGTPSKRRIESSFDRHACHAGNAAGVEMVLLR